MSKFKNDYDEEMKEINEKREEYLKNVKKDFNINLKGFFFVEDGMIPTEFEQCICIMEDNGSYGALIGVWDESLDGCRDDERGSFFDGIGGHFSIDDIVAWKPIEGLEDYIKYITIKVLK